MCGLLKCCVNCKYYEHICVLDDEAEWCHCPNHQGIISNDPNYVKSELSGECEHYEQLEYKTDDESLEELYAKIDAAYIKCNKKTPQPEPTHIKPDTWYKVDNDSREMFIEDLYAAYLNLCNDKKIPSVTLNYFKQEYPELNRAECFKLNSAIVAVNYRTNYNDRYMQKVIDYKQLIKEINEKIARKIMMNSTYGKAAFDNDPVCTEPSIVDQYLNKKRATYEKEREDAIQKVYDVSPIGKAITNFIAALKKAGLKDEMLPNFNMLWNDNCLTDAEKAMIKEIHTAYHISMTKLHEKCRQCVAILVNCETFEQKMTVLQKYDIIDSDYKLKA